MTRNLKVLLAAAVALTAIGAFSASGAQAAEFHCDPSAGTTSCKYTLKPDGAVPGTTSHHVSVLTNSIGETVSITCNQLEGSGTAAQTSATLRINNPAYTTCKANGQAATVRMNSCAYNFSAAGTVSIEGCAAGKPIEIEIVETGGIVTVGNQSGLTGVTYHNLGTTAANTTEVTVSINSPHIPVTTDGNVLIACAPCTIDYTTGNTIITAESDVATPAMVPGWWA